MIKINMLTININSTYQQEDPQLFIIILSYSTKNQMSFIPKNASKILKNDKLLRQYALNPYGYKIPKNCHFPKQHPQYKFFEHKIKLHRPGKTQNLQPNVIVFKVDEDISKPQLKQYISKLYNVQIQKINTARFMGKVKRDQYGKIYQTPNFKKAFVFLNTQVPAELNNTLK